MTDLEAAALRALHQQLEAIQEGDIAATAREAGIEPNTLRRLRRGENLNVSATTLLGLSRALGVPIDALLGQSPVPAKPASNPARKKLIARLQRELAEAAADARALGETLAAAATHLKPDEAG